MTTPQGSTEESNRKASPASSSDPSTADQISVAVRARSLDAAVEPFDLPPELAALARAAARRTRLFPREQIRVAAEVAQVIRGHLDAGAHPGRLPAIIGDLDDLAAQHRALHLQKRGGFARFAGMLGMISSIVFVFRRRTVVAVLLAPVLLYIALFIRFQTGTPTISRNFVAEANALVLRLSPEERAELLYAHAHRLLGGTPQEQTEKIQPWMALRPDDEAWAEVAAYLEAAQPALAMTRRAAAMPHLGHIMSTSTIDSPWRQQSDPVGEPAEENPYLLHVLLPYLSPIRSQAQLLLIDALSAAAESDGETAAANLSGALRIAGHLRQHANLINDLVAWTVLRQTSERLGLMLELWPDLFSDEQLERLAAEFGRLSDEQLSLRLDGERAFFYDNLQRMFTDDGRGSGRLTPDGLRLLAMYTSNYEAELSVADYARGPWLLLTAPSRREFREEWERIVGLVEADAALQAWQRGSLPADMEFEWMRGRAPYALIWSTMPAFSSAFRRLDETRLARDAAILAIALERFRRATDEYPAALQELRPEFLQSIPIDQYDGRPLKFVVREGRPHIYSSGLNRRDDGGRFVVYDRLNPNQPSDVLLWPLRPDAEDVGGVRE